MSLMMRILPPMMLKKIEMLLTPMNLMMDIES